VQRGLDLSKADLALLARNSIEASFLPPEEQRRWMAEIDRVAQSS